MCLQPLRPPLLEPSLTWTSRLWLAWRKRVWACKGISLLQKTQKNHCHWTTHSTRNLSGPLLSVVWAGSTFVPLPSGSVWYLWGQRGTFAEQIWSGERVHLPGLLEEVLWRGLEGVRLLEWVSSKGICSRNDFQRLKRSPTWSTAHAQSGPAAITALKVFRVCDGRPADVDFRERRT